MFKEILRMRGDVLEEVVAPRMGGGVRDGDEEEARLDRELDGDGSDSDSDLDLHTPLPYVLTFRSPFIARVRMLTVRVWMGIQATHGARWTALAEFEARRLLQGHDAAP